ncbi:hypothetical protein FOZ63_018637, partial [Perkinsus olseni]
MSSVLYLAIAIIYAAIVAGSTTSTNPYPRFSAQWWDWETECNTAHGIIINNNIDNPCESGPLQVSFETTAVAPTDGGTFAGEIGGSSTPTPSRSGDPDVASPDTTTGPVLRGSTSSARGSRYSTVAILAFMSV